MATNVGILSAEVADRVRDPSYMGTSQANVILLLSFAQQVINGIVEDVVVTSGLVLQPRTVIYALSGFLPNCVHLLAMRDASGRDLDPLYGGAGEIANIDLRWPVAVSDVPRSFAVIGRDLVAIHPGVNNQSNTLTAVYSQLTSALATTSDTTVLQNESDDALLDLTEILLLLKNRDLSPVKNAMARMATRLNELRSEER